MSKIIVKSRYIKDKAHITNYLKYIATREGVELLPDNIKNRAATAAQNRYIHSHLDKIQALPEYQTYLSRMTIDNASRLITAYSKSEYGKYEEFKKYAYKERRTVSEQGRDLPATEKQKQWISEHIEGAGNFLEYEDYLDNPTVGNASDLIVAIAEYNVTDSSIYLQYIAQRPGVEKIEDEEHGLWGLDGKANLKAELEKIDSIESPVWVDIVSLRREDAHRLGYENSESFRKIVVSNADKISELYNIELKNLNLMGAFHNEGSHPHIHMMFYSSNPREGHVEDMKRASEKMRSMFLNEIFKGDVAYLKQQKTEQRKELDIRLEEVMKRIYSKEYSPPIKLPGMLADLSEDLQGISGKLVYGYLPPEVKQKVNAILEYVLQADKQLANIFASYCDTQEQFVRQYADEPEKIQRRMAEFREKFFHPEKNDLTLFHNCIVKYAAPLSRSEFQEPPEIDETVQKKYDDVAPTDSAMGSSQEAPPPDDADAPDDSREASPDWEPSPSSDTPDADYTLPGEQLPPSGFAVGDENLVDHLIADARAGKDYAYFKLGKMLEKGELVEQDHALALNMFAEAAERGNPYAAYRAARMYRIGIGSPKSEFMTDQYFYLAFKAFEAMAAEKPQLADRCLYRMGMMAMNGEGIPADLPVAARYFADAAYYGNSEANYQLGLLYLKGSEGLERDVSTAVECLRKSVVDGNLDAMYTLGKIFQDGKDVPKNAEYSKTLLSAAFDGMRSQAQSGKFFVEWTKEYKEARNYLFALGGVTHDFETGGRMLQAQANVGNVLAIYDLARLYADGLGRDTDLDQAHALYAKALEDFQFVERQPEPQKKSTKYDPKPYIQYRIGKMYARGLGTDQDYSAAASWYKRSAGADNKFAQYALAGLYYRGQGVEKDLAEAFRLYALPAKQGNAFAAWEAGKMARDGIGVKQNAGAADTYFRQAYEGFLAIEDQTHDDKIQYRLGKMLETGTGTAKDLTAAIRLYEKSSEMGNANAQYALAKIWLAAGDPQSVERAIVLLTKSAKSKNPFAQYALGRLYLDGKSMAQDIPKACELLTASALQDNDFAQYKLGCLYLDGNLVAQDIENGLQLLTASAELGNQYSQYRLGCIHLAGEGLDRDLDQALDLLRASAGQGNAYAAYRLGRIYTDEKEIPADPDLAARYFSTAFNGFMAMETAQPDAQTEFRLGAMLLKGEGCIPDVGRAVSVLNLSASKGNQFAQYTLGKLYLFGKDVPKDKVAAVQWLTASAKQGNEYAKRLLASIEANRSRNIAYAATMMIREIAYGLANETRTNDRLYGEPNNAIHRAQVHHKFRRITPQQQPQRNIADDISY